MTLVFNPVAFKHNITEQDVEAAMATAIFDEDIANIFHAMKCRKELLRTLWERGYYADFN
jgi:hypothetical protein